MQTERVFHHDVDVTDVKELSQKGQKEAIRAMPDTMDFAMEPILRRMSMKLKII